MYLRSFLEKKTEHYKKKGKQVSFIEEIDRETIRIFMQIYTYIYLFLMYMQDKLFPISNELAIKRGVAILGSNIQII